MCRIIVVNNGQIEISTPRQFKEYFKSIPIGCTGEFDDECLCPIDISGSLDKLGIKYEVIDGDYYVQRLTFTPEQEKKLVRNLQKFREKLEKKYDV